MAPPVAPAAIGACPAEADNLVPLINQNRQPITDPAEARNIYQSTFSTYPPDALCQKDGAMYINHSHPILARMEASESIKDLSDEELQEKIQHMDYEVASLAGEQITLIADLKSNQAQLKQLQALGFNAEKFMKTLGETFLEFGPIVGGMAASLTMGTKGLSHLAGLSNLLANAGMQNAQFQQATIKAFRDHFKLCGNMSRENFTLGVSYVLNLVLAWQTTKYIAKIIESVINGTSGSTHGTDNILAATPEEIMAQGRLAQENQLTALAGKNRAELEKLYADLKQKRDDLHGGNKGLMAVKQQILPQLERLQKENGVLAHDDNSLIGSFMHNPDPSQKWGALLGFGALGALGLIAIHQAIKADNPNKPLTPHQLRNFTRAKQRVLKRIANGTLKACDEKTITEEEMRTFAEEFFGAGKQPAPAAVPKPAEGSEAAPADGTRAELEMTRIPTSARAGQTHWSAPTTNGSRAPVGANPSVRPTSIPDGVPSRPEFTSARPHVPTSAPKSVQYPVPIQGAMYTWFDDALPYLYDGEYIQLINTRLQATYAQWKTIFPAELANRYIAAAKNLVTPYARDHARSVLEVSEAMKRFIFKITEKEITAEVLTVVVAGIRDTVSYPLQSEITRRIDRAFAARERLRQYVVGRTLANPNLLAAMSLIDLEGYGTLQAGPSVIERVNQYLRAFEVETVAVRTAGNVVRLPISRATIVSERALATGTDGARATGGRMGSATSAYRGTATGTTGGTASVTRLPSATSGRAIPRTGGGNGAAFGRATTALGIAGWALTFVHLAVEGKASGQCGGFFDCMNKGAEIMLTPPKYDPILNAPRS